MQLPGMAAYIAARTSFLGEQIVTLLSPAEAIALPTDAGWDGVDLVPPSESATVVFAVATLSRSGP